jgi:very-short-patch-repair endonuclease
MSHAKLEPHRRRNARSMRRAMTDAERKLCNELRAHRLMGLGFRRQMPLAGHIADFACPEHRLTVEVDGAQHGNDQQIAYDVVRTRRFEQNGRTVLRLWNDHVLKNINDVCDAIIRTIGKDKFR